MAANLKIPQYEDKIMTVSIEVVGLKDVRKLIDEMPDVGKKTIYRSINDTARKTKTNVAKTVRLNSTVKSKYAKEKINIPYKATLSNLKSQVDISGSRIPVIGFSNSQTKKGVSAKIFKTGSRKLYPRSFKATMPNGHTGVYWRDFASHGGLVPRLGITELTDLSIPQLVDDSRVWNDISDDANTYLDERISHHYEYYVSKL